MTTTTADQLTDTIANLKDSAAAALETPDVEHLIELERYVNEVDAYVREVQQSLWASQAKAAIRSLERGEPLTEADREVIRAFIVSDAEGYLAHENNFADWQRELSRLMDDLSRRANQVDRNTIADLRGVLQDAIRLVPDIRNYLEERRRVEKFEAALDDPDKPSREMFARLLTEQLRCTNR